MKHAIKKFYLAVAVLFVSGQIPGFAEHPVDLTDVPVESSSSAEVIESDYPTVGVPLQDNTPSYTTAYGQYANQGAAGSSKTQRAQAKAQATASKPVGQKQRGANESVVFQDNYTPYITDQSNAQPAQRQVAHPKNIAEKQRGAGESVVFKDTYTPVITNDANVPAQSNTQNAARVQARGQVAATNTTMSQSQQQGRGVPYQDNSPLYTTPYSQYANQGGNAVAYHGNDSIHIQGVADTTSTANKAVAARQDRGIARAGAATRAAAGASMGGATGGASAISTGAATGTARTMTRSTGGQQKHRIAGANGNTRVPAQNRQQSASAKPGTTSSAAPAAAPVTPTRNTLQGNISSAVEQQGVEFPVVQFGDKTLPIDTAEKRDYGYEYRYWDSEPDAEGIYNGEYTFVGINSCLANSKGCDYLNFIHESLSMIADDRNYENPTTTFNLITEQDENYLRVVWAPPYRGNNKCGGVIVKKRHNKKLWAVYYHNLPHGTACDVDKEMNRMRFTTFPDQRNFPQKEFARPQEKKPSERN